MNTIKRIPENRRRELYRALAAWDVGREILSDLALECSFFNDDTTADMPELIGKQNLFKYILKQMTPLNELEKTQALAMDGFIKGILSMPIITKKEGDFNDD